MKPLGTRKTRSMAFSVHRQRDSKGVPDLSRARIFMPSSSPAISAADGAPAGFFSAEDASADAFLSSFFFRASVS